MVGSASVKIRNYIYADLSCIQDPKYIILVYIRSERKIIFSNMPAKRLTCLFGVGVGRGGGVGGGGEGRGNWLCPLNKA